MNIYKSKLNLNGHHSINFLFKANSFFLSEFFNDLKKSNHYKLIIVGLINSIYINRYLCVFKQDIFMGKL